ncbi:MAG: hypothetical protein ACOYMB_00340 [Patescibacteria group bacterium]
MKKKNSLLWIKFFVISAFSIAIIALILSIFLKGYMPIIWLASGAFYILLSAGVYYRTWQFWRNKKKAGFVSGYVALLEYVGNYNGDLRNSLEEDTDGVIYPGPHCFFNLFQTFEVHQEKGEDMYYSLELDYVDLFQGEADYVEFKGGQEVKFLNASLRFRIVDPRKVAYKIEDYTKYLIGESEDAITLYCKTIEFEKTAETDFPVKVMNLMDKDQIKADYGLELVNFSFSRFQFSAKTREMEDLKEKAEYEIKVEDDAFKKAEKEQKRVIVEAATQIIRNGPELDRLEKLKESWLTPEILLANEDSQRKWTAIGKNQNVTVILDDSNNSLTSLGAKFGIGTEAAKKEKK